VNNHSVHYHPSDEQLTEFSAGVLPMSRALCIAAHVEHCPICEKRLASLQQLGSAQMEALTPQRISGDLKDRLMARIKTSNAPQTASEINSPLVMETAAIMDTAAEDKLLSSVPRCLSKWVPESFDDIDWSFVTPQVSISELCTEGSGAKAALVRVKAGGSMAHHSHTGDEVTVILEGSFSDEDGCYKAGDYIFRDGHHNHKPVATNDQDCICLIVLDGPIQLTGWLSRLLNPFLRLAHNTPALAG
jgi:putative transcriptional regulator